MLLDALHEIMADTCRLLFAISFAFHFSLIFSPALFILLTSIPLAKDLVERNIPIFLHVISNNL